MGASDSRPEHVQKAVRFLGTGQIDVGPVITHELSLAEIHRGIELMRANVYSPEYNLEKYLRDSKALQLWLAGQQVSRYDIARGYYELRTV